MSKQTGTFGQIHMEASLSSNLQCHTMSKAHLISKKVANVVCFLVMAFFACSVATTAEASLANWDDPLLVQEIFPTDFDKPLVHLTQMRSEHNWLIVAWMVLWFSFFRDTTTEGFLTG